MEIDDFYLFFEAIGSEIASLQMGGSDISTLTIVEDLKEYVINVKRELCPQESLR